MAGLGLPAEVMAAMQAEAARSAPADIAVWPENWPALRVFVAMGTQWRRAGMAGLRTGLDYAALPVVAGALAVALDEDLLSRLRVLEHAALGALAEAR